MSDTANPQATLTKTGARPHPVFWVTGWLLFAYYLYRHGCFIQWRMVGLGFIIVLGGVGLWETIAGLPFWHKSEEEQDRYVRVTLAKAESVYAALRVQLQRPVLLFMQEK
jgi:hypothetical protein